MKVHIELKNDHKAGQNRVFVNGHEIHAESSRLLRDHSPDGFCWGYSGSGPAQSALGICLELFGSHLALCVYQDFKNQFVSGWAPGKFTIDITQFFEDTVMPAVSHSLIQWASQIAWSFEERSLGTVSTFGEIDVNLFTALFRIDDEHLEWAALVCKGEPGYFLKKDAEGWHILVQYPITHTLAGFLIERALSRTGAALSEFGGALRTATNVAQSLALATED